MASTKSKKLDDHTKKQVDELDSEFRIYTRDHYSPMGNSMTRHKACTRGVGANFPQYFSSEVPGMALLDFYQTLAKMRMARVQDLAIK
jgi:hypothetical protein